MEVSASMLSILYWDKVRKLTQSLTGCDLSTPSASKLRIQVMQKR